MLGDCIDTLWCYQIFMLTFIVWLFVFFKIINNVYRYCVAGIYLITRDRCRLRSYLIILKQKRQGIKIAIFEWINGSPTDPLSFP